jgi:hypothetical protein
MIIAFIAIALRNRQPGYHGASPQRQQPVFGIMVIGMTD